MTKLLAFSDLHGKLEFLKFCDTNDLFDVDCIVFGGDFVNFFSKAKEAKQTLDEVFEFFKDLPFFFVWGNVDFAQSRALSLDLSKYEKLKNSLGLPMYLHNKIFNVNNLSIGGSNFLENNEVVNDSVFNAKLFLSHEPPFATNLDKTFYGTHIGSEFLKKKILINQPKTWICGHVHESKGNIKLGQTNVYNCGPADRYNYLLLNL